MDTNIMAARLHELGNVTRLEIFRALVRAGNDGMIMGHLVKHMNIPPSTLSFHVQRLVQAGFVTQCKSGREVCCCANLAILSQVINILQQECCVDVLQQECCVDVLQQECCGDEGQTNA